MATVYDDRGNARYKVVDDELATTEQNWASQQWPTEQWINDSASNGSATTTDNTVIYTSGDVSMYNYHIIENTSTTDGLHIDVSVDGTNFVVEASVLLHDDVTTGGGIKVVSIPAGDIGILEGKFKGIRIKKNGTTSEDPSCRYAHTVK